MALNFLAFMATATGLSARHWDDGSWVPPLWLFLWLGVSFVLLMLAGGRSTDAP